jgi:hypothetical protein
VSSPLQGDSFHRDGSHLFANKSRYHSHCLARNLASVSPASARVDDANSLGMTQLGFGPRNSRDRGSETVWGGSGCQHGANRVLYMLYEYQDQNASHMKIFSLLTMIYLEPLREMEEPSIYTNVRLVPFYSRLMYSYRVPRASFMNQLRDGQISQPFTWLPCPHSPNPLLPRMSLNKWRLVSHSEAMLISCTKTAECWGPLADLEEYQVALRLQWEATT